MRMKEKERRVEREKVKGRKKEKGLMMVTTVNFEFLGFALEPINNLFESCMHLSSVMLLFSI